MFQQVNNANQGFKHLMSSIRAPGPAGPGAPSTTPQPNQPQQPQPPPLPSQHQQPPNPQQQSIGPTAPPVAAPARNVSISHKKKPSQAQSQAPTGTAASISTPTPPPAQSASTPTAQAATPSMPAPSPQTPKSPKVKSAPKPKPVPARRKASKASTTLPDVPSMTPAQTPVASSSTPPDVKGSTKRAREEDIQIVDGPSAASNSAPSPKRAKPDWDGPPSEALQKRKEEVENIQTDEDATSFVERMTELLKMANDGQDSSLTANISESLDAILAGMPGDFTLPSSFGSSTFGDTLSDPLSPPSAHMPANDPLVEFFDFSSYSEDDPIGSIAPTPDLLHASSTDQSPQSASSEADGSGHSGGSAHANSSPQIADAKVDDLGDDPLRLGVWKEIDGGESSYYHSTGWKWDQPMPTMDWAISTSSS